MASPREIYESALAARQQTFAVAQNQHYRFGYVRLMLFAFLGWTAWKALYLAAWSPWSLLGPISLFVVAMIVHGRVIARRDLASRSVRYYERALARLDRRWAGTGSEGTEHQPAGHLYAADLDLFGRGNLFQWMNQARTRMGEAALADWLLRPGTLAEIRDRSEAIRELTPAVDLREQMSLTSEAVAASVHPEPLRRWAEAAPSMPPASWRGLVYAWNGALLLALLAGNATGVWSPALVVLVGMAGFGLWLRPRVLSALEAASAAAAELGVFAAVLAQFENRTFASPKLQALSASLRAAGPAPSVRIQRLARLAIWIDSREHAAMRLIGPLLMLGTHLAFAADTWRAKNGQLMNPWLSALGEFEALLSLSAFTFENPGFVWPDWVDSPTPVFDGEAMSHPLLDPAKAVSNSIALTIEEPFVLVSGSNMSGKSTFLRTLGLTVVMAHAGAPVPARQLRLSRLAVGASISTHDSLQEGASRFFAEISRLRAILALAESGEPVFFLLDELLSGTNSSDRRIGAEGVLRGLRERGAVGLVTTHDLALAEVAQARQVHFADSLKDGKIHFDYRMRPGVVPGSNALALMHALGLPVRER